MRGEQEAVPALVSTEWLAAHLHEAGVRVADVRWYLPTVGKVGREEYARGHIPGAVFVDLEQELAGAPGSGPGRHPLPSAERFAAAMARAGVGLETHVVAYDDAGGSIAARLWWLLRYFGHPRVSVLDGGITRWMAEGRAVETAVPSPQPREFTARPQRDWVVDKATVEALSRSGDGVLLDARAAERYEGRAEPVDPRAGHIPGARSAPFAGNLREEPAPRMKPAAALRARFEALGVSPERAGQVVAYCGSGVTACHTLLALHLAGLPDGLLYEGSWSDWSADPSLPAATGPDTGGGS
ncbi:MAG TPA: sulfurtransferase [Chloroflexota bacterium]|nr:sulfurtransferase [Chloroflexota bacterium]